MNHPKTYELNASLDESMQLIKVQNKKIQQLYTDIESKDKELSKAKTELSESQNTQLILRGKIEELTNHIIEMESNLISQDNKEKTFFSEMQTIKSAIDELQEQIKSKDSEIIQLRNSNKDLNSMIASYSEKLLLCKEKIAKSDQNEKSFQEKAKELVNIIQSQDKEIKSLTNQILLNQKENESLRNTFSNSLSAYKKLELSHKENEDLIIDLNNMIKLERAKNSEYSCALQELNQDYSMIKSKYEEMSQAKTALAEKERTIMQMSNDIKNTQCEMQHKDMYHQVNYNDMRELVNYINLATDTSLKWADTYIGSHHNEEVHQLSMKDFCFKGELNSETNDMSNALIATYEKMINVFNDLFARVNSEYSRYDIELANLQNDKQNAVVQYESGVKKVNELSDELNKHKTINEEQETAIYDIANKDKSNNDRIQSLVKEIEEYESDIAKYYDHFIEIFNQSRDALSQSKAYENIFTKADLNKPLKNGRFQLGQLKELSINCVDLSLCLMKELQLKNKALGEYAEIKSQCEQFKSEITNVKKTYSNQRMVMMKEREEYISKVNQAKIAEVNKLDENYRDMIEKSGLALKEKEEEIEKLTNDNHLLYSQYLLSEKNFENFKANRKNYDEQISSKYEQIKQRLNICEQENKKFKSDFDIAIIQIRSNEQILNNTTKENEELKTRFNEMISNTII